MTAGKRSFWSIDCIGCKKTGMSLFAIVALVTCRRMHDQTPTLFCFCDSISFPALDDLSKGLRRFDRLGCSHKVLDQACAKGCRATTST